MAEVRLEPQSLHLGTKFRGILPPAYEGFEDKRKHDVDCYHLIISFIFVL